MNNSGRFVYSTINMKNIQLPTGIILSKEDEVYALSEQVAQLKQEVVRLRGVLANNHPLVSALRKKPRHLNDDDWESLEELIDSAHQRFIINLRLSAGNITTTEKRICILIKLSFSHTDMAEILLISPASLSQIKSRLKRKLLESQPANFHIARTLDEFITNF